MMGRIWIPDNPDCWPQYDAEVLAEARWDPKRGHRINMRRLFYTIDADRWYLVMNVFGHSSRPDRGGRIEKYETVHGVPRPKRGIAGYTLLKDTTISDRIWHHGMYYNTTKQQRDEVPIGAPVPISVAEAFKYWEQIRQQLRLSEQMMAYHKMPKPVHHVIDGKPFWWKDLPWQQRSTSTSPARPTQSAQETVARFRRAARSSSRKTKSSRFRTKASY